MHKVASTGTTIAILADARLELFCPTDTTTATLMHR
jgi:hypothetical protein